MKCKDLKAFIKKNKLHVGKKSFEFVLKTSSEKYRKKRDAKLWEFKPMEPIKTNYRASFYMHYFLPEINHIINVKA